MLNKLIILLVVFSLVGCTSTYPVQGRYKTPNDPFDGNVSFNSTTKTGTLAFTTASGIKCSGHYIITSKEKGSGSFKCDNDESGTLFVSAGIGRGFGSGTLDNGETFTFKFGQSMKGNCADCHTYKL